MARFPWAPVVAVAAGLVLSANAGMPATADDKAPTGAAASDPVAATVEGEAILRSEIEDAFATLPQELQRLGLDTVYPMLLDRMVQRKLLVVMGRRDKLDQTEEVKEQLREVEDQLVARLYLNRSVEARLSEEVLREEYHRYIDSHPPQEEIRASHILLQKEEEARKAIAEIRGGKDFAAVARESSIDPGAQEGGDLGYFTRDVMVPAFSEAAFAMQPGEVSKEPVRTQFGWHVIRVEDRRRTEPPTYEEARPELAEAASRHIVAEVMEELVAAAKVERFGLDGKPLTQDAPSAPK